MKNKNKNLPFRIMGVVALIGMFLLGISEMRGGSLQGNLGNVVKPVNSLNVSQGNQNILPPYKLTLTKNAIPATNLPGSPVNKTKVLSFNMKAQAVLAVPVERVSVTYNGSIAQNAGPMNCELRDTNANKTYGTFDNVFPFPSHSTFKPGKPGYAALTIAPNATASLDVYCDLSKFTTGGDNFTAQIEAPASIGFKMYATSVVGNNSSVIGTPIVGPTFTNPNAVGAPTLTMSTANTPNSGSYDINSGKINVPFFGVDMFSQNGTTTIKTLTFQGYVDDNGSGIFSEAASGGVALKDIVGNLSLYNGLNMVSGIVNVDAASGKVTFSNLNVVVPNGSKTTLTLRGTIFNAAPIGGNVNRFKFGIDTPNEVAAFYGNNIALPMGNIIDNAQNFATADGGVIMTVLGNPDAPITRAEFMKLLVETKGAPINTMGGPHFLDVPQGTWFYDYVETAVNNSWIQAFENNTFLPYNNVNRAVASELFTTVFIPFQGYINDPACEYSDVVFADWYHNYVNALCHYKVLDIFPGPGVNFSPSALLTKSTAQTWATNAKNLP